jgi:hypothetical protein
MVSRNPWWPLGALLLTGCPCGREDSTVLYRGGTADAGTYESSSWPGPWLHFPGGRTYLLVHHLGQTPASVSVYLSFKESPGPGNNPDEPGNASQAAGNETVIERVDANNIQVKNDTCSEFFLRVVATTATAATDAGTD